MEFVKMHGAGNDFVLLDFLNSQPSGAHTQSFDGAHANGMGGSTSWSELARAMCDRHFGIGSDGLLLVVPSEVADARMRMFNPDGSESASCGNGIRCLGRYVHDRYGLGDPALRVETGAGVTTITNAPDGRITVDMGQPIFRPSDIPTTLSGDDALDVTLTVGDRKLPVSCVSMGNPHAVLFVEAGQLEGYPLETIGPQVEHNPLFPARTNFEVCEILGPDHMRVRVWERGAGITLACGTGACAATVVATRRGLLRPPALVDLPGGQLTIEWTEGGTVLMTGPTAYVFTGTWPDSKEPLTPTLSQRERGQSAPTPGPRPLTAEEAAVVG